MNIIVRSLFQKSSQNTKDKIYVDVENLLIELPKLSKEYQFLHVCVYLCKWYASTITYNVLYLINLLIQINHLSLMTHYNDYIYDHGL